MRHSILRRTVSLFLSALLLLGCVHTASAAAKKIKDCACFSLEQEHIPLFYVPSTLPSDVSAIEWKVYMRIYQTVIWGDDEEIPEEYADTCEISLVSGNESIRDALVFEVGNTESKEHFYSTLRLDNAKLTEPGRAVIRLKLESEHFLLEKDLVFCVASWDEYPAFSVREGERVVSTTVSRSVSIETFRNAFAEERIREASAALAEEGDKFNWYNSVTVNPADDAAWDMMAEEGVYGTTGFKVKKGGSCDMLVSMQEGNIKCEGTVRVDARAYELQGPGTVKPGESVVYHVNDTDKQAGRVFSLSAEGDGIIFDAETGTLSVPDSIPSGTQAVITATPDKGEPVSLLVTISNGALHSVDFTAYEREGFAIPVPDGEDWTTELFGDNNIQAFVTNSKDEQFSWSARFYIPRVPFVTNDDEAAIVYSEDGMFSSEQKNIERADVMIDGHKGRVWTFENYNGDAFYGHTGLLYYARDNRLLSYLVISLAGDGGTVEGTPRITLDDMKLIAGHLGYDESKAPLTAADAQITVTEKNGATSVSAGKSLDFTADFANPDRVRDMLYWSVIRADGGECGEIAGITDKGKLTAAKAVAEPAELLVRAVSPEYGTAGEYRITVLPAVRGILVEPSELYFYTGTDIPRTVQAVMDPDTVPPLGLTWTLKGKEIVAITAGENGAAEIRPLAAGKGTVTVAEPGGKNAKLAVNVVDPVESVELAAKGQAKPGKNVMVSAALAPKSAGNKNVEWSVDVDENIASINEKGQLKIAKEAAPGTVITVTCRALGAPDPVTAKLEITVE